MLQRFWWSDDISPSLSNILRVERDEGIFPTTSVQCHCEYEGEINLSSLPKNLIYTTTTTKNTKKDIKAQKYKNISHGSPLSLSLSPDNTYLAP